MERPQTPQGNAKTRKAIEIANAREATQIVGEAKKANVKID